MDWWKKVDEEKNEASLFFFFLIMLYDYVYMCQRAAAVKGHIHIALYKSSEQDDDVHVLLGNRCKQSKEERTNKRKT